MGGRGKYGVFQDIFLKLDVKMGWKRGERAAFNRHGDIGMQGREDMERMSVSAKLGGNIDRENSSTMRTTARIS